MDTVPATVAFAQVAGHGGSARRRCCDGVDSNNRKNNDGAADKGSGQIECYTHDELLLVLELAL